MRLRIQLDPITERTLTAYERKYGAKRVFHFLIGVEIILTAIAIAITYLK